MYLLIFMLHKRHMKGDEKMKVVAFGCREDE